MYSFKMRLLLHLMIFTNLSTFLLHKAVGKTHTVYLNSAVHCSGNKMFPVSIYNDYIIKPDVMPDKKSHIFRDCEVTFHSERENGHICLVLVGNEGTITDNNAQLEAKDGLGDADDDEIDTLMPFVNSWQHREYCSAGPYITLYLSRINKERTANIRKVNVEFNVLDIESKDRKLYLDGSYCSQTYYLENSMVTLWNRPKYSGIPATTLESECPIRFDKMEENRNKSICFAYVPSEDVKCSSNWMFIISKASFDLDKKHIVYSMRCNSSEAKNIHVWCSNSDANFVTVILLRDENVLSNSSVEPAEDFQYVVMDYEGSEESLLKKVRREYSSRSSSGGAGKWMIYTIAAVAAVFFIIILISVIVCCKRRFSYKEVDIDETSKVI